MEYNNHVLRHELKYMITYHDYYNLSSIMDSLMKRDEHSGDGGYFIRSLYFDDVYNSCYREKEDGVGRRRKYRIRTYNMDDGFIRFEIKDKFGNYISKQSAVITAEQCRQMMDCDYDFMLDSGSQTLRMGYIDARTKLLRPKVLVDYFREVFVCEEGNVRITFDSELRAGIGSNDILNPNVITLPAMDDDKLILEVKYDDFLPLSIKRILSPLNRWQSSVSKFWLCRKTQNVYYRKDLSYESTLLS